MGKKNRRKPNKGHAGRPTVSVCTPTYNRRNFIPSLKSYNSYLYSGFKCIKSSLILFFIIHCDHCSFVLNFVRSVTSPFIINSGTCPATKVKDMSLYMFKPPGSNKNFFKTG